MQDVADAGAVGGHLTCSLGCGLRFEVERVDDLVAHDAPLHRRDRSASPEGLAERGRHAC